MLTMFFLISVVLAYPMGGPPPRGSEMVEPDPRSRFSPVFRGESHAVGAMEYERPTFKLDEADLFYGPEWGALQMAAGLAPRAPPTPIYPDPIKPMLPSRTPGPLPPMPGEVERQPQNIQPGNFESPAPLVAEGGQQGMENAPAQEALRAS